MARRKPPQVGTVGSTIVAGLHMAIYRDVSERHYSVTLELEALHLLEALRRKLGDDHPIADFVARAGCSKCDDKWPKLSVSVGATYRGMRLWHGR